MSRRKPCGVCAAASSARSTACDDRGLGDALDRVDDGQHRDGAVTARVDRGDHPLEHGGRRQRARGVVHQHDLDVAPTAPRARCATDSCRVVAAGDDRHEVATVAGGLERVGQRIALTPVRARRRRPAPAGAANTPREGVPQDRVLVDADERLRTAGAEPGARPGRDDDDGDARDGRRVRHGTLTLPGVEAQEARTSSRTAPACSSSVFSASASSEIRIWRAFASMRFSPAERPRS